MHRTSRGFAEGLDVLLALLRTEPMASRFLDEDRSSPAARPTQVPLIVETASGCGVRTFTPAYVTEFSSRHLDLF